MISTLDFEKPIQELEKKISELTTMAKKFSIEGATGMPKQELIFTL